jgi:hypothetical protein
MPYDLAGTVAEIERQLAEGGWDQPPRLYALVNTGELRAGEPALADLLEDADPDGLTPVEQDAIEEDPADLLARIEWPETVAGCAFVHELLLLPDGVTTTGSPEEHPDARDVRMVVGVLRDGERASILRIRDEDGDDDVIAAPDLVPNLALALLATLAPTDPPAVTDATGLRPPHGKDA